MISEMQELVIDVTDKFLDPDKKLNINGMKNEITKALKSYVIRHTKRTPMIMPVIMVL